MDGELLTVDSSEKQKQKTKRELANSTNSFAQLYKKLFPSGFILSSPLLLPLLAFFAPLREGISPIPASSSTLSIYFFLPLCPRDFVLSFPPQRPLRALR
jgi:hypothetical protein